jgi:hypothetical protein
MTISMHTQTSAPTGSGGADNIRVLFLAVF